MKICKLGSSIKVIKNGKENFLTVDMSECDIILHKSGVVKARRVLQNNTFTFNDETYIIKN